MEITGVNHFAIGTYCFDRTIAFYRDYLEFQEESSWSEDGLRTVFLSKPGVCRLEIIEKKDECTDQPSACGGMFEHIAMDVADVRATEEELLQKGAAIATACREIPVSNTRVTMLTDPNGISIALREDITPGA